MLNNMKQCKKITKYRGRIMNKIRSLRKERGISGSEIAESGKRRTHCGVGNVVRSTHRMHQRRGWLRFLE